MANREPSLTAANIRYLLVLHALDRGEAGVRSIDIAERLQVTKPSVHTMIKVFQDRGYVKKEKYESVHLTEEGRKLAAKYADCFEPLFAKMLDSLKLSKEDCRNAACAVLSEMPEAEIGEMAERLRNQATEPAPLNVQEEGTK